MNTNLSAAELRHWAARCDAHAKDPMISGDEYERLVRMRDGLLAAAASQEWLEGQSSKKAG
ncbi:MAG TPA: hypothetical protein VGI93_15155 [Steroidobacteraceae bacterium]|jgi:hypothetical protein